MANQIDELVAASLAQQRDEYIGQVQEARDAAQVEISASARALDNQFKGFLTGAIPPASSTNRAGVNVRDALGVSEGIVREDDDAQTPILFYVVIAFGVYYFFIKKKGK